MSCGHKQKKKRRTKTRQENENEREAEAESADICTKSTKFQADVDILFIIL